jgi:hypothetical protein
MPKIFLCIPLLALTALPDTAAGQVGHVPVPEVSSTLQQVGGARPRKGGTARSDGGQINAPTPPVAANPPDADGQLNDDELLQLFKGNSSFGFMANDDTGPFREYYAPSGKILGYDEPGAWSIKDNTVCAGYDGKKPWCYIVRRVPGGAYSIEVDGQIEGYLKIVPGNYFEF